MIGILVLCGPSILAFGFALVMTTLWCNPTAHDLIARMVVAYIADIKRPMTEEEIAEAQIFGM